MEQTPGSQQEPEKKDKFDPKKPPDKSNFDDIYNFVAKRISGPSFRNPLKNFIDENCTTFIDVDENIVLLSIKINNLFILIIFILFYF